MSCVFVSYSRANREVVSNVVRVLRLLNMELWLDTLGKSHGIPYSTKWFNVIEDALYRASGAIVFISSAWEMSKPCQAEFKLICQNHIPFIKIDLSIEQSINDIAKQINKWNGEVIKTKKNSIRTELFTNVKNYQKDKGTFGNIPTYSKLKQFLLYASEEYKDNSKSEDVSQIHEYLRITYRKKHKRNLLRLGGLLIAAILFILIQADIGAFLMLKNAENKYLSASSGAIQITEVMHVNPYYTMDSLIKKTSVGNQVEFMNIANLMVLNNLHLPIDYIKNGNMDAGKYLKIAQTSSDHEMSDYSFLVSRTTGMVMLSDSTHQVSKQIVVDGIIDAYCWNESGEAVAFAVAEKAYVYDIASSNCYPVILDGNFEDIGSIGWDGNRIFAITTFGNIIIWQNPVLRPTNNRDITKGKMFYDAGGNLCAVYISDDNLIFSRLQNEETIPLGVKGKIDESFIAVSHVGTQVAVTYTPTNQTNDRILIVDLDTKRVTADYSLNCVSMDFVFSKDDISILVACFDFKGVAKLDLTDGQVAFSQSVKEQYYSIALWKDEYILSTIYGVLILYDENLNVLGNGLFISGTNGNALRN